MSLACVGKKKHSQTPSFASKGRQAAVNIFIVDLQ
jgi:hypothetical protein